MNTSNTEDYSLSRMTRGEQIAKEKTILENGNGSFSVPSQTVDEVAYLVRLIDGKYVCNCFDFKFRNVPACKHVFAVKSWIALQVEIKQKPKPKVFSDDSIQCAKCGSIRVVKYGFDAEKQIFKCKDCKTKFRYSLLKKAKYSPEIVSLTLDLYFSGTSLAKTARIINNQFDTSMNKVTVYRWIQKFIPKISDYVNSLAPSDLSEMWHVDEVFQHTKGGCRVKTNKKVAYLWQVMDRKTRFMLASKLSKFRDDFGATQAFNTALENAHGFRPEKVFTDSARAYKTSVTRIFGAGVHVQNCGIGGLPNKNNNRIERANGTTRERLKVQRGWKSMETQIPEGFRIHYNFVKPHEALEGMTPAQRAGIEIAGKNKWKTLIENASKSNGK